MTLDNPDNAIFSMQLHLTNNCNLNCPYCFIKKDSKVMSYETGKNAIDFLIQESKNENRLHVNFFGGEPLLQFKLLKKLVIYLKNQAKKSGKPVHLGMTTNGSLFNQEIVDFFYKNKISILFSWDGTKQHIVASKGESAYNSMLNSLRILNKKGYNLTARVTVSPDDLDIVKDVKHIFEVGFKRASLCMTSGTHRWEKESVNTAWMQLAKYYVNQAKKGKILQLTLVWKNILSILRMSEHHYNPCGAGERFVAVNPEGTILPCHHTSTWEKDFVFGNVRDKKIDMEIRKPFLEITLKKMLSQPECKDCEARVVCAGSCPADNYDENKELLKPYNELCMFYVARVKCAKYILQKLYYDEKNIHFIKEIFLSQFGMQERILEANLTVKDLDKVDKFYHYISFSLEQSELKLSTGEKILEFVKQVRKSSPDVQVIKSLPLCIFGSNANDSFKRLQIKKQKINLSNKHSKLNELWEFYKENATLPNKCKFCKYRIKNDCYYCYLQLKV